MTMHEPTSLCSACDSGPHGKKSRNGLNLDGLARLLVAIVVEAVLFVPEYFVNRLCQRCSAFGVHLAVGRFAQLCCNNLHRLKFPEEVAREIHALISIGLKIAGTGDLVVHPARIGAIPNRETIAVTIVGKPSVDVPLQSEVIARSQPFVVITGLVSL